MQHLMFNLIQESSRPIFTYEGLRILLDTGSEAPVWVGDIKLFNTVFPDAKLVREVKLTGFSEPVTCPVYECLFCLGKLTYPNLPIVIRQVLAPCHMLINPMMLKGFIFEFNYVTNKFNITVPNDYDLVRTMRYVDKGNHAQVLLAESEDPAEVERDAIWRDYCKMFSVTDEESEMIRLMQVYQTRDTFEILEKIKYDYLM